MTIQKGFHCAYNTHYHLVFPVKYRKALLSPEIACFVKATALEIEARYEIAIEQIGNDGDHIHLLVSFHPKYSIGYFVRVFKSITARALFKQFPGLKRELWGGEFWTDGYYVATVGTGGNWKVVEAYVKDQGRQSKTPPRQLSLW
jgi:putative transposase